VDAVSAVAGVAVVSANGWGEAHFEGEPSSYSSVDPTNAEDVMNLDVSEGSLTDLGKDGVVVARSAATSHGWSLGDTVAAQFAESGDHSLRIVGIYDTQGWIGDDYVISVDEQRAFAGQQLVSTALVTVDKGADVGQVQDAIDAALADHPDAQVLDQAGFQ
jgi:putative ABC transport system permease protein